MPCVWLVAIAAYLATGFFFGLAARSFTDMDMPLAWLGGPTRRCLLVCLVSIFWLPALILGAIYAFGED